MRNALGDCGPVVSLNRRDGSNPLRRRPFRPMTVCRAQSPTWTPCGVFPVTPDAPVVQERDPTGSLSPDEFRVETVR